MVNSLKKFVGIYSQEKYSIFLELTNKEFYSRDNTDFKSWKFTMFFFIIYIFLLRAEKIYYAVPYIDLKLLIFLASNALIIVLCYFAQKADRANYRPYYPSKLEFYDNLEKVKKNYIKLKISIVFFSLITLLSAVWYLNTGSYISLMFELGFCVFSICCILGDGLFYKKKLIKMIENMELP